MQDLRFKLYELEFRAQGVNDLGLRVEGLGFRVCSCFDF